MNTMSLRRAAAPLCLFAMLFSTAASAESNVGGTPARNRGTPPPSAAPVYEPPAPAYERPAPTYQQPAPIAPSEPAPVRPYVAPAQDNPMVRRSLEDAIAHERSTRNWAIGGIVTGGVIVIGGLVYTSIEAQRKANRTGKDQFAVNWIGLGVGLPVIGISIYQLVGAQRRLNRLRRQSGRVSLLPAQDGAMLSLAMEF